MSNVRRSTRLRSLACEGEINYAEWDDLENIDWNKMYEQNSHNHKRKSTRRSVLKPETEILNTPTKILGNKKQAEKTTDTGVSPPKQKKQEQPENLFSPSKLFDRLSIDDDSNTDNDCQVIDDVTNKPEPIGTPKSRSKYQNARRVLNSAETETLPGRENELEKLKNFLNDHLDNSTSASLYVSGPPGTGKTACLSKLLKSDEFHNKFIKVYVNCTSISSIGSIYKKLCTELKLKVVGKTEKDHLNAIESFFAKNHKMVLMVLDEIDQLVGKKQAILYTIFEWPSKRDSKLVLIGIANSLDLTDRMLVRLNAKCELKPQLLHFAPYTKQQIIDIFKSRLEEAGVLEIFPPTTIQLLAGKVASVSGDVRRALDIGRRVVEITEQQRNSKAIDFKELGLDDLPEGDEAKQESVEPVQIKQVMNVLNNVYGASQTLDEDIESAFPLQQKILLCSLLLMLRKEKNKDITIGRLHDVYKRVCMKRNILAVDQAEFVGLTSLVETRGIIRIIRKKEPRLSKIALQWDDEEVRSALQDKQLIASILEDAGCLGK